MQKKHQMILKKTGKSIKRNIKKIDIVICTALIPEKSAPIIIKDNMINNMQPGSVIYDLAAIQGGNTAFTEVDKIVTKYGVKIMGESNILNKLLLLHQIYMQKMYLILFQICMIKKNKKN